MVKVVAQGLVYICASMFHGLGNTMPLTCFVVLVAPVIAPPLWTELRIEQVWQWLVASHPGAGDRESWAAASGVLAAPSTRDLTGAT